MPDTPAPRIVFKASEQHRAAPSVVHFGSLEEIKNPDVGGPGIAVLEGCKGNIRSFAQSPYRYELHVTQRTKLTTLI